jgi:hypothetical protein
MGWKSTWHHEEYSFTISKTQDGQQYGRRITFERGMDDAEMRKSFDGIVEATREAEARGLRASVHP